MARKRENEDGMERKGKSKTLRKRDKQYKRRQRRKEEFKDILSYKSS